MRKKVFSWLGREFVELSGEARSGSTVEEETRELFLRFAEELKALGLSLENTVRTRIWGTTRDARNLAARERSKILAGTARAPSSSYVSPYHFDSTVNVALDLIAMRPSRPALERKQVEFEPPRAYLRYLRTDSLVFVSGFTSSDDGLENQVPQVLADIEGTLNAAGTAWNKVVKLSAFQHRGQKLEILQALLRKANKPEVPQLEIGFVDGFAGEKSLLEIEVTAETEY